MIFILLAGLLFIFWKLIEDNSKNDYIMLASGSPLIKGVIFLLIGSFVLFEAFLFVETNRLIEMQDYNQTCVQADVLSSVNPSIISLATGSATGDIDSFSGNGVPYVINSSAGAELYLNYSTPSTERLWITMQSNGSNPVTIYYLSGGSWVSIYAATDNNTLYDVNTSLEYTGSPLQLKVYTGQAGTDVNISRLQAIHAEAYSMYCASDYDTGFIVGMHKADYETVMFLTLYMPYIAFLLGGLVIFHYLGLANNRFKG